MRPAVWKERRKRRGIGRDRFSRLVSGSDEIKASEADPVKNPAGR